MNIRKVYPKGIGPSFLTTSAVTQFTADKRYGVERFCIANVTGTDTTISLYVVRAGGSVADSRKVLGELNIPANDQTTIELPVILEVGDFISALASASTSLTLMFNVNDVEVGIQ